MSPFDRSLEARVLVIDRPSPVAAPADVPRPRTARTNKLRALLDAFVDAVRTAPVGRGD